MRLFVAVDFDDITKNKIFEFQKELKSKSIKGRWRYMDNFHLTLKFLDEVDVNKVKLLHDALTDAAAKAQKFSIRIDKLGCFKGNDSIRTVWLGISGEVEKLDILYSVLEENLQKLGFPRETREYKPHVTIGQDIVFEENFENLKDMVGKYGFDDINICKIILMNSEQIGNKRVYTPIGEYKLMEN